MEAILSTLNKTTVKSAKRIGRGIGSGKGGHTTGRGQKGQNSRGKIKLTFDGADEQQACDEIVAYFERGFGEL